MSKTKVIKYWLENFPGLTKHTGTKLYTKVGPTISGIEIINLPRVQEYRPHFVLYPLYRKNIKECLRYPDLMFEIENVSGPGKHKQYDLPFEIESVSAESVIKDAKSEIGFAFDTAVSLYQINNLFDKQIAKGLRVTSLIKAKYLLNLVMNNENQIIEQINKNYKNLEKDWLSDLNKINRNDLMKNIEDNSNDAVLDKLNEIELIGN